MSAVFLQVAALVVTIASAIFGAFWVAGLRAGRVEAELKASNDRVGALERLFIEKATEYNRAVSDMREEIGDFHSRVGFLEGKLNGRNH